jgi:hypothetical protein
MTINGLKFALVLIPTFVLGCASLAQGQSSPTVRLVDVPAPAELIACANGAVPEESETAFEQAVTEAEKLLLEEMLRLRITRAGESFVNRIDQTQDAYPVNFELCRSIEGRPTAATGLSLRELPPRTLRVGYCPSTDADRCREALKTAQAPPSAASQAAPSPFVVTRVASWDGAGPPASAAQMLDVVLRLAPVSIESPAGGAEQAGEAFEVRDEEPREAGDPGRARSAAPPRRMEAPTHRPAIGFVFAVSK